MSDVILRIEDVSKNFGAVKAVEGVTLEFEEGKAHAIIGPNGAGKTTLMDLIVNRTHLSSGKVFFRGEDITLKKPYEIVEKGMVKCYQITQFFPNLTCYQNIKIAHIQRTKQTFNFKAVGDDYLRKECLDTLSSVGMAHLIDERAAEISYGDKKRLEIAIALAKEPAVLLLDEPAAGVARAEGHAIMQMIQRLSKEKNLTVIFIEHDMDIVFNYADKISVMDHGKLIATDSPEGIKLNKFVREAYLGGAAT